MTEGIDLLGDHLTPDQAARALRCSRRTLDNMHARREGPPRTVIARRVYFQRAALERWVAEQQEPPLRRVRR